MKNLLLAILLLIAATTLAGVNPWQLTTSLKVGYDSNVFKLSDDDCDLAEDGSPDFAFVEATDDLTLSPKMELHKRFRIKKGVYLTPFVEGAYTMYTQNTDKYKWDMRGGASFYTGDLSLRGWYGYYPHNYVRQYVDRDATKELEDYTYDKNSLSLEAVYRLSKHDRISGRVTRDQYFYNEYFTENDGAKTGLFVAWQHSFKPITVKFEYGFTNFNPDNDPHLTSTYIRDCQWEADNYSLSLTGKAYRLTKSKRLTPYLDADLEHRVYTTDLSSGDDPVHSGRKDTTWRLSPGLEFTLDRNSTLALEYQYETRQLDGIKASLEDAKEYTAHRVFLSASRRFSLGR